MVSEQKNGKERARFQERVGLVQKKYTVWYTFVNREEKIAAQVRQRKCAIALTHVWQQYRVSHV